MVGEFYVVNIYLSSFSDFEQKKEKLATNEVAEFEDYIQVSVTDKR